MFRFVFFAILASVFVPLRSFELIQSGGEGPSPRIFGSICRMMCDIQSRSFWYQGFQITVKPPLLCGICDTKGGTTTPSPTKIKSTPPTQMTSLSSKLTQLSSVQTTVSPSEATKNSAEEKTTQSSEATATTEVTTPAA